MPIKSVLFIVLVKSSCPSFCQLVQSDTEKKKLKSPPIKMIFLLFFVAINFCFMYFDTTICILY